MPSDSPGYALWQFDCEQINGSPGLVGLDEAGRGALAGPVVAGAVWAGLHFFDDPVRRETVAAVNDSKQLKAEVREAFLRQMAEWEAAGQMAFATGAASVEEIEQFNILGATRLSMERAVEALHSKVEGPLALAAADDDPLFSQDQNRTCEVATPLLVDGRPLRPFRWRHRALVQGDSRSLVIALASIAAKVTRDRLMLALSRNYPAYGFASNKGYGTASHRTALCSLGASPVHRRGFLSRIVSQVG